MIILLDWFFPFKLQEKIDQLNWNNPLEKNSHRQQEIMIINFIGLFICNHFKVDNYSNFYQILRKQTNLSYSIGC